MKRLTAKETAFLDAFLYEATTSPFTGPATRALHEIGVEYGDISYIAWAFEQEVPPTAFELGHVATVAPPLPWSNREAALDRNKEIERQFEMQRSRVAAPASGIR